MRKPPSLSVVPVFSAFVSSFLTVTAGFCTTAPCGSLTVPPMAPSVVDCAAAVAAPKARQKSSTASAQADLQRGCVNIFLPFLAGGPVSVIREPQSPTCPLAFPEAIEPVCGLKRIEEPNLYPKGRRFREPCDGVNATLNTTLSAARARQKGPDGRP